MEPKKRSKTIEVIDSRTGNPCKVACMSCIRGHRTTACGKNVCRTKLFWTVKRPGRPANTCTCPLGATGRCQCVIATSACPHRTSKGESRSVDCRCDEQGRWCCVLDPDDWQALALSRTPNVDFYPTPEALNAARTIPANPSFPSTPSFTASTPQSMGSLPSTPGPLSVIQPTNTSPPALNNYQPQPSYQTPRFGLMGIGTPLGGDGYVGEDVLKWQGQTPQAPREFNNYTASNPPALTALPTYPNSVPAGSTHFPLPNASNQQYPTRDYAPVTQSFQNMTMQNQGPTPEEIQRDRMMEDYYNYQFPSAICQNCGLAGCNCRSCPAVMQSSIDGSWAQCCSRKHVRTAELVQRGISHSSIALEHQDLNALLPNANSALPVIDQTYGIPGLKPGRDQAFSPHVDPRELGLASAADAMVFSDFVETDPELPSTGCCCGGDT